MLTGGDTAPGRDSRRDTSSMTSVSTDNGGEDGLVVSRELSRSGAGGEVQ